METIIPGKIKLKTAVKLTSANGFWTFSQIELVCRLANSTRCCHLRILSENVLVVNSTASPDSIRKLGAAGIKPAHEHQRCPVEKGILANAFIPPPKLYFPKMELSDTEAILFKKWKYYHTTGMPAYGFYSCQILFPSKIIHTEFIQETISVASFFAADHLLFFESGITVQFVREDDLLPFYQRLKATWQKYSFDEIAKIKL